jgi:hypothetical protein
MDSIEETGSYVIGSGVIVKHSTGSSPDVTGHAGMPAWQKNLAGCFRLVARV